MKKRVVVFGKDLALDIADWFRLAPAYVLSDAVPVVPRPEWCGSFVGSRAVVSGDYHDVRPGRIDLGISCGYARIFDGEFIDRCDVLLNIHFAPLPAYRGMRPINWALKNGDLSHAVTIHEVTPDIDAGVIVAQVFFDMNPERDEVEDVYNRCKLYAWPLFLDTMKHLQGRLEDARVQCESPGAMSHYMAKDAEKLGDRAGWRRSGR